ncbi:hypothetical protein [Alistipes indistinctus]|uniref:hypothetical protein n=1 Tax=Alistipes indistinctus TaxID=626932 RepID=UPI0015F21BC9|nr:hypothetical protein [Alistipes indistinctus]BCG54236.1 hypothetical protein AI2BBH_12820 [Alistipes indistinctus]
MKTQVFLSLLAAGVLLAGCSKSENEGGEGPVHGDGQLVAIRLSSGIGDAAKAGSKAPVTAEAPATVQIEGWENTEAEAYAGASTWQSTAAVTVSETAAAITLSPVQYYNADENIKTYIKGWYPQVASADGEVTFTNTDGTVDVLYATEVSGDKNTEVDQPLVFNHKSAQLVFKVVKGEGLAAGTKIKTIKVKNTAIPTSLTLSSNTVNYTDMAELEVPNVTVAEIGETAAVAGDPLMVKPVDDNTTVTLYIETTADDGSTVAATYDDVALTTSDGKLTEGSAYTVTLTFKQAGISLEANITPWTEATGEGEVI